MLLNQVFLSFYVFAGAMISHELGHYFLARKFSKESFILFDWGHKRFGTVFEEEVPKVEYKKIIYSGIISGVLVLVVGLILLQVNYIFYITHIVLYIFGCKGDIRGLMK